MPNFNLTLNGISYCELHEGSGRVSVGSSQGAVRVLQCAWTDAVKLALFFRGWRQIGLNQFLPTYPQQHPSGLGLACTDISIAPMGKPTGENTWQYAKLTCSYTPCLINNITINSVPAYDLLDEQLDFSADMATLGKDGWTYDDDSSPVQSTVQILVPQIAYTVTQYHVTKLQLSTIYSTMNCLNLTTFRGALPGFMLYLGAQANRKIVGTLANQTYFDWTVVHKFLVANRSLLYETNPATGVTGSITGAGGTKKYTSAEFGLLGLGVTYA